MHFLLLLLLVLHSLHSDAVVIVVDPISGNDSNSGMNKKSSVRSLLRAQNILRQILHNSSNHRTNIVIELMSGIHRVPQGGLQLTQSDSPIDGFSVTWRGRNNVEEPPTIISGGIKVTGWKPSDDPSLPVGVYVASIPQSLKKKFTRQLYIDSVRARRTRRLVSEVLPNIVLEKPRPACIDCSYIVTSDKLQQWSNPSYVEFVYSGVAQSWSEARCGVLSVEKINSSLPNCTVDLSNEKDCGYPYSTEEQCIQNRTATHPDGCCWHPGGLKPTGHYCVQPAYPSNTTSATRVTMRQPCFWNLVNRMYQPVGGRAPKFVENVREHLNEPGEWYFDSSADEILYYPLPGQDMNKVEVMAAVEETLVYHDHIMNHKWEHVSFEYATWLRPSAGDGFVEQQSAACDICPEGIKASEGCGKNDDYVITPGNVVVNRGRNLEFVNCSFTHLGAYGVSANNGSQNITWRGCLFEDISAGALMLGDVTTWNITDITLWDKNFIVEDNKIFNIPVEFTGATGIFAAYVDSTTIQHNTLVNLTYSGMTIGWGWGREGSRRGNNHIVANRVETVLLERCCDGGGIYTLGPQPGSIIQRNYILQSTTSHGNAIYHDNGSGGFTDTDNVIDGPWSSFLAINGPLGPYGPDRKCPGKNGEAANCGIIYTNNWLRTKAGGHGGGNNITVSDNTKIPTTEQLPHDAAAIATAAGARY